MEDKNKVQHFQLEIIQAAAEEWPCSPYGYQAAEGVMYQINLVTGEATRLGSITPASNNYNAIGFNPKDNVFWGYDNNRQTVVQINPDLTTTAVSVPGLPSGPFFVGDVDKDGHYYLFSENPSTSYYSIDVNQGSPTYLQVESHSLSSTTDAKDWGFNPIDNQLYGVQNNGQVIKVDPLTGAVTALPTTGLPPAPGSDQYGAVFFDPDGALYAIHNSNGVVYRITFSGTPTDAATGVVFSQSAPAFFNDGARCVAAPLNLLDIGNNKKVDLAKACTGDVLTYTVTVRNWGTVLTAMNSIFKDTIPTGTTFIPGSVIINGAPSSGNPNDGVPIGDIAPQQSVTVTFQVRIGDNPLNPIVNQASVSADNSATTVSNQVSTHVIQATLTVTKEADVGAIQCDRHITYTISITNEGPDDLNQIEVLDPIDPKTTFVPNSVKVDGVPQTGANPTTGITINPFPAHTTKVIQFQVQVVPNTSGWIYNKAQAISCGTNVFTSNQTRVKICPCNVE
ncbi:DUF11 domain-containing protein [Bacillus sp. CDB3]|uniref:DUF6923 family protein n=1 Tax=Bacillus sp. CDB3 TaxID=360310 RepID=UPI0009D8A536|nr:DUF11 domain-containing protein [Bacillus sp. CDB3]OQR53306.1 hypothetical protein CDB3_30725 [Bacillus sp. CDB3]